MKKNPSRKIENFSKVEPESSSSSEEEEEEDEIQRELADVTFEELQKARSDGSLSIYRKEIKENKIARANKNRPMEVSCKKPVSRYREVIQAPKKLIRDPRFESLSGNLDVDGFRNRYKFLFEEELPAEREELRKQMKKSNDPKVIAELKNRIYWIDKQLKFDSTKRKDNAILAEHKKREREAAKQGKRPFYLKKSDIKRRRNIEKFHELKAAGKGKLESYVEKRRKKNAAKDHRYMPYRRPNENEE